MKKGKRKKEKMKMENQVFVKNPPPWLKAPAGAFFIDKKYSYEKHIF